MYQRRIGQTGPMLPPLALGAMSLGGAYGPCTPEAAQELLACARDLGIVHVDTANVYGKGVSEDCIGTYVRANGNPFHIATKAGISADSQGRRAIDNSARHLESELDGSLRRMGIEAVDLFYVHRRDPSVEIEDVSETLARLVKAGKARATGFSEIAPTSLLRAHNVHPVAAVQSEYSLASRAPDLGLRQACERIGASFVAFSPVGRGLLTDAPPLPDRLAASPFLSQNPRFQPRELAANNAALASVRAFARELNLSMAALAVAWVLGRGSNVFAIPGTRSPEHLREISEGARRGLNSGEVAEIERFLPAGWCHGDRYSDEQYRNVERYC
jgi:aryl-alcohol dehydrogenase-like predicted oxidoreductase